MMHTDKANKCGTCGPGDIVMERNNFFTGKYMTKRDFQADPDYFLSRHRLHNRLLHGWGIVCGLEVEHHPDKGNQLKTDCAWRWVVVKPGIAIDCYGRELILKEATPFKLPIPPQKNGEGESNETYRESAFLLCLRFSEKMIEPVPALYVEGTCDPTREEANRIREMIELTDCDWDEEAGCWHKTGGDIDTPCRDDCGEDLPGPAGTCLDVHCPCGEMVPLALILPNDAEAGFESGFRIDLAGRHELPPSADYLTHIVYHNWPHGGDVRYSTLVEEWNGRLRVLFDRELEPAGGHKTGIHRYTFLVQYSGATDALEFVRFDLEHPPALEGERWAVFTIDDRMLRRLENQDIYVTLKCDFIMDCHDNPVDGDYLKARLPSGNGTPGGTFESWFRVVPDSYREEESWQQQA